MKNKILFWGMFFMVGHALAASDEDLHDSVRAALTETFQKFVAEVFPGTDSIDGALVKMTRSQIDMCLQMTRLIAEVALRVEEVVLDGYAASRLSQENASALSNAYAELGELSEQLLAVQDENSELRARLAGIESIHAAQLLRADRLGTLFSTIGQPSGDGVRLSFPGNTDAGTKTTMLSPIHSGSSSPLSLVRTGPNTPTHAA